MWAQKQILQHARRRRGAQAALNQEFPALQPTGGLCAGRPGWPRSRAVHHALITPKTDSRSANCSRRFDCGGLELGSCVAVNPPAPYPVRGECRCVSPVSTADGDHPYHERTRCPSATQCLRSLTCSVSAARCERTPQDCLDLQVQEASPALAVPPSLPSTPAPTYREGYDSRPRPVRRCGGLEAP